MTLHATSRSGSPCGLPRVVVAAAVGLLACNDTTAPLPSDGPPRELTFSKGGFVNVLYDARLAGDTVIVTRTAVATYANVGPSAVVTRRVPTADEWRAFWRTVGDLGVARWPGKCYDTSASDGDTFTYALSWTGTRRTGSYYASYPTRAGTCSRENAHDVVAFQQAVYTLAGLPSMQLLGTP